MKKLTSKSLSISKEFQKFLTIFPVNLCNGTADFTSQFKLRLIQPIRTFRMKWFKGCWACLHGWLRILSRAVFSDFFLILFCCSKWPVTWLDFYSSAHCTEWRHDWNHVVRVNSSGSSNLIPPPPRVFRRRNRENLPPPYPCQTIISPTLAHCELFHSYLFSIWCIPRPGIFQICLV